MGQSGKFRHKMAENNQKQSKIQDASGGADITPELDCSFRGVFTHAIDEKGRVSLPAEFRKALSKANQEEIILTNFVSDGTRCLEGYSLESWKRFEAKLAKRSRFDPQVRKVENFYLARSAVCQIDSSGRINIPSYLRTYAGIEKEVSFTSASHGFRIWDRRVWELVFQEAEAALLDNPALFVDVDI